MTIHSALQSAGSRLAGISDAPLLDAQRLLLHVLGSRESAWLWAHGDDALSAQQEREFKTLTDRRAAGEPLAYLLGEWEFYGRPFFVTPDVLIPRPATEELVEAALQYLQHLSTTTLRNMVVADIGTGSGCIAITLACELTKFKILNSKFHILATDISPAALAVARKNAERHGVADRIEFIEGDMLSPLVGRQIDLIVSNPPYVPAEALAKAGCAPDTIGLKFEPRLALDGGPDGQHFVNHIQNSGVPAIIETIGGHIVRP